MEVKKKNTRKPLHSIYVTSMREQQHSKMFWPSQIMFPKTKREMEFVKNAGLTTPKKSTKPTVQAANYK